MSNKIVNNNQIFDELNFNTNKSKEKKQTTPFFDGRGVLVEPGSPFYDKKGNLIEPGSPFYDKDGFLKEEGEY